MIKRTLKDYLRSLKFYFTPLGVLSIFFVFGLLIFVKGTIDSVQNLFAKVGEIVGETHINIDWGRVWDIIWTDVKALNWGDPLNALGSIFSKDFLTGTLHKALAEVYANEKDFVDQVMATITNCSATIAVKFAVAIFLNIVGSIVGYIVLVLIMRTEFVQVPLGRNFLTILLDICVLGSTFLIINIMGALWKPLLYIFLVIGIFGIEVFSILEAFWFHGKAKTTLKELLNPKKVGLLFAGDAIVCILGIGVFLILLFTTNAFVTIFFCLPLIEVTLVALKISGERYVLEEIGYDKDQRKQERKDKRKEKREAKKAIKLEEAPQE